MKRWLSLCLAAFCLSGCLSGCRDPESNSSTDGSGKAKLLVVTQFGGDDSNAELFSQKVAAWCEQTGNEIVNHSAKADNTWKTKVITDFHTGSEPDVLFFFNGSTAEPIWDQVVDVETIQAVAPEYGKNIRHSVLYAVNNVNGEGKPVSLPIKGYGEALYCNTRVFEEAGAALPTDWASLLTAIEKIQAAGKIPMAVSLAGEPHYFFDHLILSVGGEKAMAVNPKSMDEVPDSWVRGLSLLHELYAAGAFSKDALSIPADSARTYFLSGDAGMYLDGSWFSVPSDGTEGAPVTEKDVQLVPFPSYTESENQPGTLLSGFSSGWYISKKCWEDEAKRQAAIDFVLYNTSDEAIGEYVLTGGGFPASDTAAVDETKLSGIGRQYASLLAAAPATPTVAQDNLQKAAFEIYLKNAALLAKGEISSSELLEMLVKENAK